MTTLLDLRARIRQLTDDPDKLLLTDAAMNDEINASGRVLHSILMREMPHVLESVATITPLDQIEYALPADHHSTLGVRQVGSNGESTPLRRVQYPERAAFSEGTSTNNSQGYYVKGEVIGLLPPPATGSDSYKHDYIASWTALSADGDKPFAHTNEAPLAQWVDWIVYDVAAKARMKEHTDYRPYAQYRDELQSTMLATHATRELEPARVVDVRNTRRRRGDPDFWSGR